MKFISTLLLALFISGLSLAQLNTALPNIHSHNDYLQNNPLFGALEAKAKSIEIDLFYRNGSLLVAHNQRDIKHANTLENLYIRPLKKYLVENKTHHNFHLMIDIKTEPVSTLNAIQETLKKYPEIFSTKGIQIVISGHRPKPENYNSYADFIGFDGREASDAEGTGGDKIAVISQNLSKFTHWRGKGEIPANEKNELISFITQCHNQNKMVRLWNSGDNEIMYQFLCEIGVDYINTDDPQKLRKFLDSRKSKN